MAETYDAVKSAYLVKQPAETFLASKQVQKAKELFEEAGDFKGQGMVLGTIMGVLIDNGLFEQAVKVGKDRASLFRNAGDVGEEASAMLKLGEVFLKGDAYA